MLFPAQTFVIDAAVAHPVLPFVQALEKKKFILTSAPGKDPISVHYGTFWKQLFANGELFLPFIFSKRMRRWAFTTDTLISVAPDPYGNHTVTVTAWSAPRAGNNFLFEIIGTVAEKYAQAGQLLHCSEYFEGDAAAMKKSRKNRAR